MIKRLIIVVALLLWAIPSHAQGFVQVQSADGTNPIATFTNNTAAGNTIVATPGCDTNLYSCPSTTLPIDLTNPGVLFSLVTTCTATNNGTASRTNVYVAYNIPGGTRDSISYQGGNVQMVIMELSGATAVDQAVCATGHLNTGGTATSGPITTTHPAEIVLGVGTANCSPSCTSTDFTAIGTPNWTLGTIGSQVAEYRSLTSITSSLSATATVSGGSGGTPNESYAMAEVSFWNAPRVQGTACVTGGSVGSTTCSLSGVTAGDTLLWFANANNNGGMSVTNTCGGTNTTLDSNYVAGGSSVAQGYITGGSGSCTVTFTSTGGYAVAAVLEEITSGYTIDKHSLLAYQSGNTITTTSVTTTAADYCFTGYADQGGNGQPSSLTVSSPFVQHDFTLVFPTWGANVTQTSAGAVTATWTSSGSGGTRRPAAGMMCFSRPTITLTLNPQTVASGYSSVGTVMLGAPAPSGGATVTLSSSDTAVATVPLSVLVPAGSVSATFTVNTGSVSSSRLVNISATYSSLTNVAILGVVPVNTSPQYSIWSSSAVPSVSDDGGTAAVEVGVKFTADTSGFISGIRFYKSAANTGTHVGSLWSSTGQLLATATFTGESTSGWQTVNFSSPILLTPNTIYVASYHTNTGHTSADPNYFTNIGVDNSPLHAPASGASGGNGVRTLSAGSAFPTTTNFDSNYWVDVIFLASASPPPLQAAVITSANNTTFTVGTAGTFTVTATGSPTPTLSETGALPVGVTFTAATGKLAGTPGAGTEGSYPITFTAHNGVGTDATQNFTLTVVPPPPPSAVKAAYSFNAGSGLSAADLSGNGNNGTLQNGVAWTTAGKYGSALSFDGTDDFVSVPDSSTLDIGSSGTIEAWVKLDAIDRWNSVLAKGNVNSDPSINYGLEVTNTNQFVCSLGSGSAALALVSTTAVTTGTFYHVACVWNGTQLQLYINGVLNTSVAQNLTPAANTSPLNIGQWGGNVDRLSGVIDEVRIYGHALTQTELSTDMNTPVALPGPAPIVSGLNPVSGIQGQVLNVVIAGGNFQSGATCGFGSGITVTSCAFNSATQLTANVTISAAATVGTRTVTVTNPDAQSASLPNGFTVSQAPAPAISGVNPLSGMQGQVFAVTIAGNNFQSGASCSFGSGITVTTCAFNSATQLTANITISAAATTGTRTVTVTNADGQSGSLTNGFTVNLAPPPPPPTLTSLSPNSGQQTQTLGVTLNGNNFLGGASCNFGTGITINSCSVTSATQIAANITVTGGAATGARSVTVTNPDGQFVTLASAFTVNVAPPPPVVNAAYSFNAGSGLSAADLSGNGNNGTLQNGVAWTTAGKYGSALSFDGTDDFVSVPDSSTLDIGSSGTIEAWVKLNAVNRWNSVLAKGNVNSDPSVNYGLEVTNTNRFVCSLGSGSAARVLTSTTAVTAGTFYHVACVWNGTQLQLYINATLNTSVAQNLTPAANTSPLNIGQWGGNVDRLSGVIDEVRIYGRALTQTELSTDMNTPMAP